MDAPTITFPAVKAAETRPDAPAREAQIWENGYHHIRRYVHDPRAGKSLRIDEWAYLGKLRALFPDRKIAGTGYTVVSLTRLEAERFLKFLNSALADAKSSLQEALDEGAAASAAARQLVVDAVASTWSSVCRASME
jgi:hypothetical protein